MIIVCDYVWHEHVGVGLVVGGSVLKDVLHVDFGPDTGDRGRGYKQYQDCYRDEVERVDLDDVRRALARTALELSK